MKIKDYTCQICGTKIPTLDNMESVELSFSCGTEEQINQYYVCPYCKGLIMGANHAELYTIIIDHFRNMINKNE